MATYHSMVLQSQDIPLYYNLAASLALWSMLAGILVLSGTFTSLKQSTSFLQQVPLLPIAGLLCCTGIIGLGLLWFKFRNNYFWVLTHLFLYNDLTP